MSFEPYSNTSAAAVQNARALGYSGISTCARCGVREDAYGPGHACGQCADRAFESRVRTNPGAMAVFRREMDRLTVQDGETRHHAAWEAACDYHRRGGR